MRYAVVTTEKHEKHLLRAVVAYRNSRPILEGSVMEAVAAIKAGPVFLNIFEEYQEALDMMNWVVYMDNPEKFDRPKLCIVAVFGNFQELPRKPYVATR